MRAGFPPGLPVSSRLTAAAAANSFPPRATKLSIAASALDRTVFAVNTVTELLSSSTMANGAKDSVSV